MRGEPCTHPNCHRKQWATGLCNMHYKRQRKGQPMDNPHVRPGEGVTPEQAFWANTKQLENGCIVYTGKATKRRGYKHVHKEGVYVEAHRYAWMKLRGPIPPGMLVCHKCDNPPCCNVEHLFLGTHKDNTQDMIAKGRRPTGKAAGYKLTAEIAAIIKARCAAGENRIELGKEFGISESQVHRIRRGIHWSKSDD